MKKHMLRLTFMAFVTLSAFSSCKKDKDEALSITTENLIGNYKLVDVKMKTNLTPEASVMSELDNCEKDNVLQLQAGGVIKVVDEGEKCDTDEEAKWALNGNKISLNISMLVMPGDYDVVSLSKKQLVVSMTMTEGPYTVTYTGYLARQ